MGNRAVVIFKNEDVGVYLHWNGGRDSVEPMLEYCKLRGFRSDDYGVARFIQIVANFFGGSYSIGAYSVKGCELWKLNQGDGGVYVIEDWEIVERYPENIIEQTRYDKFEFMCNVDNEQPMKDQVGIDQIREYLANQGYEFKEKTE